MRRNNSKTVYEIKEEETIVCDAFILQLTHQNP